MIFFGTANCWNTAREAERLVQVYPQYKDKVRFVVVDLRSPSLAQQALIDRYYHGYIPTIAVIDSPAKCSTIAQARRRASGATRAICRSCSTPRGRERMREDSLRSGRTGEEKRRPEREVSHHFATITGCRGHPCPRKRETHGGFHVKSRSSLLALRQLEDSLADDVVLNLTRARRDR